MKKCPFCAEEIQEEAIKCRYCNEFLDGRSPVVEPEDGKKGKAVWYWSLSALIIGFVCFGPLVLPLVWFNPRYTKLKKIVVSVVIVVLSIILWNLVATSLKSIDKYYNIIEEVY